MTIPRMTETATTAVVCLASVFLSGQMIFLNSAWSPLNQLFFWVLVFSLILSTSFRRLLCFLVHRVWFAESAVLLGLHAFRMSFLILCHVVVTVFALRTLQRNSCAHNFHLAFFLFTTCYWWLRSHRFLGIKKRPTSIRRSSIPRHMVVSQDLHIIFR